MQQTTKAAALFAQNRFADAVLSARASGQSVILIRALLRLDRWDEALAAAEDALRATPENVELQGLLALAQLRGGRPEEALATARAARKRSPENYYALLAEATLLVKWLDNSEAALPLARKLVALRPDHPESWWVLAEALEGLKETLAAVARLRALKPQGYPFELMLEDYKHPKELLETAARARRLRALPSATEFPKVVRLPLYRQEEMVFAKVTVNNKNVTLLFDTGASDELALNGDVIPAVKPHYLGKGTIKGATGYEATRVFAAEKVALGPVKLGRLPFSEVRKDPEEMPYRYDGLFGVGLLRRYAVTLDFDRSEFLLRRVEKGQPLASLPPVRGAFGPLKTYTLPLRLYGNHLYLRLELQAPRHGGNTSSLSCPLWAVLDTGASTNFISQRLAGVLASGLPEKSVHVTTIEMTGGIGVSQKKAEVTVLNRTLQLVASKGLLYSTEYNYGASPLDKVLSPHYGFEIGAVLGMPFLSQYRRATIDYPNQKLILETDYPEKSPLTTEPAETIEKMSPAACPFRSPGELRSDLENHRWIFAGNQWALMPKGTALEGARKAAPFTIARGYIAIVSASKNWWLLPEASRALPDGTWEIG